MASGRYILDENKIAHDEPDLMKWAEWFETADRTVSKTQFGEHLVSTVFLGLNHQYGEGPPLLFETMVFNDGSGEDFDIMRYTTHAQALAGHDQMAAKVRDELAAIAKAKPHE